MTIIAWKNLFHDRVRLVVTLVGIVFALVLILIQFGLFLSFVDMSANVVEKSGADLWISAPAIPHVNGGSALSENKRYQALSVAGVERVEKYSVFFVNWKLPTGAQEAVQIVGYPLGSGLGGPWNITQGSVESLQGDDTVIVDEIYLKKLGVTRLGDAVEINGRRARVVGFTRGIRSFTTSPYIFTSFKNSLNYMGLKESETIFLLVKTVPGANVESVKQALAAKLSGVDVYTNREMQQKTMGYWVFQTGAGVTTLMGAVLGLVVGIVVVAQTIYAATVDHIREFGTLKAMGASNWNIYQVILTQAFLSALFGYVIAITVAAMVSRASESGSAPILLPLEVAAGTLLLALAMCAGASVISIRKATQIDPAMVFKG